VRTQLFFCGEGGPRAPRCPLKSSSKFASVRATWDVASLPLVERCGGRHMWRRLPKRGLGGCATVYADVWSIRRLSKPRAT